MGLAKEHMYNTQPVYTHPEMFDENGNVLPDEIVAVRFENSYDEYDEEENDLRNLFQNFQPTLLCLKF